MKYQENDASKVELYNTEKIVIAEALKQSFFLFLTNMFEKVEGKKFIINECHSDFINTIQEAATTGKYGKVITNIFPGSGKTTICCYFVAWLLTINPRSKSIYTSYSQTILNTVVIPTVEKILTSKYYIILFGDIFKETSINMVTEKEASMSEWQAYFQDRMFQEHESRKIKTFDNKESVNPIYISNSSIYTKLGGQVYFVGMGKPVTGINVGFVSENSTEFKLDGVLIIDDPHKAQTINSEVMREKFNDYYDNTLFSRIRNPATTFTLLAMQRLHPNDLTNHILESKYHAKPIKHIVIPILKQDPITGEWRSTMPSIYNDLNTIKEKFNNKEVGLAQWQQDPKFLNLRVFKPKHFGEYAKEELATLLANKGLMWRKFISIDVANTINETSDHTAIITGYYTLQRRQIYIEDVLLEKKEYLDLEKQLLNLTKAFFKPYETNILIIETMANGVALHNVFLKTGLKGEYKFTDTREKTFSSGDTYFANPKPMHNDIPKFLTFGIKPKLSKKERAWHVSNLYDLNSNNESPCVYIPSYNTRWKGDFYSQVINYTGASKKDDILDSLTQVSYIMFGDLPWGVKNNVYTF